MASQNNVHIPDEMLTAVAEVARLEGRTPDEVVADATQKMLRIKGMRAFAEENRRWAEQQGFTEDDVPRLIEEYRREQRGR